MSEDETVFFLGDDALGVTLKSKTRRHTLALSLRQSRQWIEVIPGANGLSVQYDPLKTAANIAKASLEAELRKPVMSAIKPGKALVIPVCYAPAFALDMAHITAQTGLTPAAIIESHTSADFTVDMIGFTPGFAYLETGHTLPNVARLATPRQSLPAGAVGLAGGRCGLYALPGPGGWPIIGRTPLALFNVSQLDSFLLEAGDTISFRSISISEFEKWI